MVAVYVFKNEKIFESIHGVGYFYFFCSVICIVERGMSPYFFCIINFLIIGMV